MELLPEVRLDPAHLSTGADVVECRAADMRARREEIGAAVEGLLATWRGDAAARFAGLWEQWRAGADEVIAGLTSSAAALRHAREDLVAADVDRAEGHARLRGLVAMQERLG